MVTIPILMVGSFRLRLVFEKKKEESTALADIPLSKCVQTVALGFVTANDVYERSKSH